MAEKDSTCPDWGWARSTSWHCQVARICFACCSGFKVQGPHLSCFLPTRGEVRFRVEILISLPWNLRAKAPENGWLEDVGILYSFPFGAFRPIFRRVWPLFFFEIWILICENGLEKKIFPLNCGTYLNFHWKGSEPNWSCNYPMNMRDYWNLQASDSFQTTHNFEIRGSSFGVWLILYFGLFWKANSQNTLTHPRTVIS